MILGHDELVKALGVTKEIQFSSMPDPNEDTKAFKQWCKSHVGAASIDIPIGNTLYTQTTVMTLPGSQSMFSGVENREHIDPHVDNAQTHLTQLTIDNPVLGPGHSVTVVSEGIITLGKVWAQLLPRLTALRWGIQVAPGLIEPFYEGPLYMTLTNTGFKGIHLKSGTAYAQLAFSPIENAKETGKKMITPYPKNL